MLDRLRQVLGGGQAGEGVASPKQLEQWVQTQGWQLGAQGQRGVFSVQGELDGLAWTLESGAPTRDYIRGTELRLRASLGVGTWASAMVMNQPLKSTLESRVFGAITNSLQTAVTDDLPLELRWLSIQEHLQVPQWPASFRHSFAVLANRAESARPWVGATLVSQLMQDKQAAAPGQVPLVLMLSDGDMSMRMQTVANHIYDLHYAVVVFLTAAKAAQRHVPQQAPDDYAPTLPGGE